MLATGAVVAATSGWEIAATFATVLAVVIALGLAVHEQRVGNRREQMREIDKQIADLDETRRWIITGCSGGSDRMAVATVFNALRYHSRLLDDAEVTTFIEQWSRVETKQGKFVIEVAARVDAREVELAEQKSQLLAKWF